MARGRVIPTRFNGGPLDGQQLNLSPLDDATEAYIVHDEVQRRRLQRFRRRRTMASDTALYKKRGPAGSSADFDFVTRARGLRRRSLS